MSYHDTYCSALFNNTVNQICSCGSGLGPEDPGYQNQKNQTFLGFPLCINCRNYQLYHWQFSGNDNFCLAPESISTITGKQRQLYCSDARSINPDEFGLQLCGPRGLWYKKGESYPPKGVSKKTKKWWHLY